MHLALDQAHEALRHGQDPAQTARRLFQKFQNCTDFTQLLPLRVVAEQALRLGAGPTAELQYAGTVLRILLNTGQYPKAVEFTALCFSRLRHGCSDDFLAHVPLQALLQAMVAARDCEAIVDLLAALAPAFELQTAETLSDLPTPTSIIGWPIWPQVLALGLSTAHAGLVWAVYSQVLMAGYDPAADPVSGNALALSKQRNPWLRSVSTHTLNKVVHCLAAAGSVQRCLQVIEVHFVHGPLKGSQSLSKELCLSIIHAFCCHRSPDDPDKSMGLVLLVVEQYQSLFDLTHADLVDLLSAKFHNHHHPSAAPVSPAPSSNSLLEQGVLSALVRTHFDPARGASQVFLSSLLCHLSKFQNISGIITVLAALPQPASQYLDSILWQCIAQALNASAWAPRTAVAFYKAAAKSDKASQIFSRPVLEALIFAGIGKGICRPTVEFFCYEHCRLFGWPSSRVLSRLKKQTLDDPHLQLLQCMEGPVADLDRLWDSHGFRKACPSFEDTEKLETGSEAVDTVDSRDAAQLEPLLM